MSSQELDHIRTLTKGVLSGLIGFGASVALLDFPFYPNAGDLAIWAGTRAYLDELGATVRYQERHDRYSPRELDAHHPSGPILLSGGGNFGDRWPIHQEFRERVISDFPDRQIVQLPQTLEMSAATAARVHSIYSRHPRLTVLLRDSVSIRAAESVLPDVRATFCPDLAFGYTPAIRPRPVFDVIELKRNDSESLVSGSLFDDRGTASTIVTDWRLTGSEELRWRLARAPSSVGQRITRRVSSLSRFDAAPPYDDFTRIVLRSAQRKLASGRVVVTDRLHGVVLSALMGIPVVGIDNANHKIATIITDYLGRLPRVAFADDHATATRLVHGFLQADPKDLRAH